MMYQDEESGLWYGTLPVLLIRVVENEDQTETESLIGSCAPFGQVLVRKFEGEHNIEKPHSWWEAKGFTITEPQMLKDVRKQHQG